MCGDDPPALVVRDGRTVLSRSGAELREVVAALQRGEPWPDEAEARLAEAAYERGHPAADPGPSPIDGAPGRR